MGWPDSVFLFSGGADSLCAVIEEVTARQGKPALVSHRAAPYIDHRQHNLIRLLRQQLPQWDFPYTSVWVHRLGTPPHDSSQRTRSFLYASLGAVVASAAGASRVVLSDNGVVSLNLPISEQLVGALASRSTHPKFIHQMNCLLEKVLPGRPIIIANTLWDRTRSEGLALLKGTGLEELLQESNSCSNTRGLPNVKPHCGVCLQCVDRRFATIVAGLQDHDLKERYKTDVFRHDLPEGKARDTAVSYVRFARRVSAAESDDDLLLEFPQLQECVLPTDPSPDETARRLVRMLRRHADAVLRVLSDEIGNARDELAVDRLPFHCLLRLAVAAEPRGAPPAVPRIELSEKEDAEFRQARYRSRLSIQITGQTTGRKSNVVLVDGKEAVLDDADFIVFLRLALELLQSDTGFLSELQLTSVEDLDGEVELMPASFDQAVGRLRKGFRGRLSGLSHTELIEVQRRRVRLSTHCRYVLWNDKALRQHADERVRLIANRMATVAAGREPQRDQGPA
jgi:hypothetical protein